jgi:hypothetical protein
MIYSACAGDVVLDIRKDGIPDDLHLLASQFGRNVPRVRQ